MTAVAKIRTLLMQDQDGLLKTLLITSLCMHLVVWMMQQMNFFPRMSSTRVEEWSVDADLVSDLKVTSPSLTAIPDSKKAELPTVPDQILPQLPKRFDIKQSADEEKAEDQFAEEKSDDKTAITPKEAPSDVKLNVKSDPEEKNRIAMQDALKRLALEKLKQEQKTPQKELKAPLADELARLKEQLGQQPNSLNSGSGAFGHNAGQDLYRGQLQKAVGRHYAVPEAYNLKNASLKVVIEIVVNDRGELKSCNLFESSGDTVFDNMALKAIRDAAPLPRPPQGQAGEKIYMHFTPKSF